MSEKLRLQCRACCHDGQHWLWLICGGQRWNGPTEFAGRFDAVQGTFAEIYGAPATLELAQREHVTVFSAQVVKKSISGMRNS